MKIISFQIVQSSGANYPSIIALTASGQLWEGLLCPSGVWTQFNPLAEMKPIYKPIKGEKKK